MLFNRCSSLPPLRTDASLPCWTLLSMHIPALGRVNKSCLREEPTTCYLSERCVHHHPLPPSSPLLTPTFRPRTNSTLAHLSQSVRSERSGDADRCLAPWRGAISSPDSSSLSTVPCSDPSARSLGLLLGLLVYPVPSVPGTWTPKATELRGRLLVKKAEASGRPATRSTESRHRGYFAWLIFFFWLDCSPV